MNLDLQSLDLIVAEQKAASLLFVWIFTTYLIVFTLSRHLAGPHKEIYKKSWRFYLFIY